MKRLVEFKQADGGSIIVEVDEPEGLGGTVRAARKPGEVVEEAKHTFEEAKAIQARWSTFAPKLSC